MKLGVNITKKRFYVLLGTILLLGSVFAVYGYGTTNPITLGHTWGEIAGKPAVLTDNVISWSEISGIPGGFLDGIDDEGSGITSVSWSQITSKPASFADGVISWSEVTSKPASLGPVYSKTCTPGQFVSALSSTGFVTCTLASSSSISCSTITQSIFGDGGSASINNVGSNSISCAPTGTASCSQSASGGFLFVTCNIPTTGSCTMRMTQCT